jgi:hypothetical protein
MRQTAGMRTPVLRLFTVAALCAGCGGAKLSNLRCDTACQDVADPFLMKLVIDYEDPDGTLAASTLGVAVGGRAAASFPLDTKRLPTSDGAGSIPFDVPLRPARINDGDTFQVDVEATGPDGATNSVSRIFTFQL